MITKKIYPEYKIDNSRNEPMMLVTKMITEYRLFGILLLKREVFTPNFYGYKYYDCFTANI